uniref:Uncharacterized protein n=1 Tax=Meloidogyne incognita TaxID=6306 RepID=A0A914LEB3_MELIC
MILPVLENDDATILYEVMPCPNNQYQLQIYFPQSKVILHLFIILLSTKKLNSQAINLC